jgi:hypothetical protein
MKLDYETGGVVCHLDASAVKIGDRRDEAEAEAVARAVPANLKAVKSSENVLAFLHRNSRPAVSDRNKGAIGTDRDRNRTIRTAMLYGVVDKIRDRVEQQITIAYHVHPIRCREL